MGEERESIEEMVLYWDEREGERGGKPKIFRGVLAPNSLSSRLGAIGARAWWAPPGRARIHCWPHLSRSPPPKLPRRAGPPAVGPSSSSALVARARPYVRKDLTAADGAVTGGMWLTGGVRWLAPCASAGRTRRVAFSGGGVGGSGRVQY